MKDYIVLGAPGSGKGTQAKMLAKNLDLFYFGTGDLMRDEAAKNTPRGKEFQAIWDQGQGGLVSEELVISFVKEKLQSLDLTKAIVFDGFPRTIKQAEALEEFFKQNSRNYEVLNIKVSAKSLINRMETRRVCPKCDKIFSQPEKQGIKSCDSCGVDLIQREEDKPDIIRKRIDVYNTKTQPLIDYYQNLGKIINIDGEPSIEVVYQEILKKLNGN